MALTTATDGGGTSESYGDAKGEEEEEDWDPTWKGYGVRDASWLDGPACSNPKAEVKEEEWNGWQRWGWQWGGKDEYEDWNTSTSWKTNRWDSGWNYHHHHKNNKPPWAYKNDATPPQEGRYVRGGYEAHGVHYE